MRKLTGSCLVALVMAGCYSIVTAIGIAVPTIIILGLLKLFGVI